MPEKNSSSHLHEWKPDIYAKAYLGARCDCGETLSEVEVTYRLNATECLSAEDARFAYKNLIPTDSHAPNVDNSLRAYARALDGSDE